MFGTWKYDPETDEVQNLRQAFDPVTARSSQHQACNRCHEKKLKCSGEKDGCERCVTNQLSCEYTRSSSRGSRRGKKTRRRSGESTGRDESPAGIRRTTSQARGAQSSRLSPQQGHSPLPMSSLPPAVPTTTDHGQHRMIDQLDFSLLMPSDAFNLESLSRGESSIIMETTTAASSSGYLAPVTDSPLSMSPTSYQHQSPQQHHPRNFQDTWTPQHQAQGFHPTTDSPPVGHPNMATAGQGYSGAHEGNYLVFQHHHSQGYRDSHDWGGGEEWS